MPKRKIKYEPAPDAKRLEDYEPGADKNQVMDALRKVGLATLKKPSEPPDRASSKT